MFTYVRTDINKLYIYRSVVTKVMFRIRLPKQTLGFFFVDTSRAGSCSWGVYKPVWHIPLRCVRWETPDDGHRNCPKHVEFHSKTKFEKTGASSWFYYKDLSRCTVTWTQNWDSSIYQHIKNRSGTILVSSECNDSTHRRRVRLERPTFSATSLHVAQLQQTECCKRRTPILELRTLSRLTVLAALLAWYTTINM
jgi:hypothetical protein